MLRCVLYTAYARAGYILRVDVRARYMLRGICNVRRMLFTARVIFSSRDVLLGVKNHHAHHGTHHP